jgi:hypothetical protein
MIPEGPAFHKPKSFITAKNLLYASIFLSALAMAIRYFSIGIAGQAAGIGLVLTIVSYIIIILLIKQMGLCKKWARTVLTVWFAIGIASFPFTIIYGMKMDIPEAALFSLEIVLQIIALIFLYRTECNTWFNGKKYEMFQK